MFWISYRRIVGSRSHSENELPHVRRTEQIDRPSLGGRRLEQTQHRLDGRALHPEFLPAGNGSRDREQKRDAQVIRGGIPFFFSSRRRHTRWTGDWSSDVCSSD